MTSWEPSGLSLLQELRGASVQLWQKEMVEEKISFREEVSDGRILPESTAKEQRGKEHDQLGHYKRGFEIRVKGGGITKIWRGHK